MQIQKVTVTLAYVDLFQKFYRKDRTVRNTEILQPTLAVFMDEIVNKYKRYTQHVETAWMEIVNG